MSPFRNPLWWHVVLIVSVSAAFESLFLHYGIAWLFDEGWPLYAAMQLHDGAVLYRDVLFPFPPGHLLAAWIAYAVDPPGIVLARVFYAAFCVALNVAVYFVGRRITTPTFALLAALLLAIAAPRSHLSHLLFGYRYWVFAMGVLLLLSARLRSQEDRDARRFMFAAGLLAGVALAFRLTPAFAVSCGVGLAVITASPNWRHWLRDGSFYGIGLGAVLLPLLGWFAWTVGLDVLWREVVTRIVALQSAQSLASPALTLLPASAERGDVYRWFVGIQYRLYIVLYAGYAVGLLATWLKATRERRAFGHSLLLGIVVAGAIYLLRALGRSDDHHLMSALPPVCLVIAHGIGVLAKNRPALHAVVIAGMVLSGWMYLMNVDSFVSRYNRGIHPVRSTGSQIHVVQRRVAARVDGVVNFIQRLTSEDEVVLDMSGGPLFYLLMDRRGPGVLDVISPGIFLSAREEGAFVDRLRANPPGAVIWPDAPFDRHPDRTIERVAPLLSAWVRENYVGMGAIGQRYSVLRLRARAR